VRGGARTGAGRPRIYADGLRRSITMTRRHWDDLALLARMVGSTPSGVLCALVEQAVADAAAAVGEGQRLDAAEVDD
jgi:hypothetical protein